MQYADIRSSLKSGDIVALSHQPWKTLADIESQIVKCATQSEFSHVATVLVIEKIPFLVESVVPTVRIFPLDFLNEDFYLIPTDCPVSEEEREFMFSQVSVGKYSKLQAIEAQLDWLRIGADEIWSCAEFLICARKLSSLNIQSKATPAAVVKWLLQQGHTMQYITKVK